MNEHGRNDRDILRYTDVEYTPEGYENVYRWGDFLEIAGGDARYAAMLINRTASGEPEEGLHPETLVDQDIRDGEAFMLAGRPIVPEDVYDLPRTVHGLYSELVDNVGRSGTLLRDWRGFSAGADAGGQAVDEKSVEKHRNDVCRLATLLAGGERPAMSEGVRADMRRFLEAYESDPVDPKALKIKGVGAQQVVEVLKSVYLR